MIRYLRIAGGVAVGIVVNTVRFFQLLWYLGVVLFAAILVYDLCQIPVSVNSPHKYATEQRLWSKMSPEEESRLLEFQKHCRHVHRHNGFFTYYCPVCRKKLVEGAVPLIQL